MSVWFWVWTETLNKPLLFAIITFEARCSQKPIKSRRNFACPRLAVSNDSQRLESLYLEWSMENVGQYASSEYTADIWHRIASWENFMIISNVMNRRNVYRLTLHFGNRLVTSRQKTFLAEQLFRVFETCQVARGWNVCFCDFLTASGRNYQSTWVSFSFQRTSFWRRLLILCGIVE